MNEFKLAYGKTYRTQLLWAQENRFITVTGQPEHQVREMALIPAASLDEASTMTKEMLGEHYRAYIMPDGSTTFPILK